MTHKKQNVISNTSPLISFLEIIPDGHKLMKALFEKILIPEGVIEELTELNGLTHEQYLKNHDVYNLIEIYSIPVNSSVPEIGILDKGEAQAVSLAIREKLLLTIDEKKGRRVAEVNAGCTIERTAEQLVKACYAGVISSTEAAGHLHLLRANKRFGDNVLNMCLAQLP
jgi:predicted nucleic acid-binding protein